MKKLQLFALALCGLALVACNEQKTTDEAGTIGEMVDLGLSVKWADHNVGATVAEDAGNYYAWGEIATKDFYYWTTYAHGTNFDKITKYGIGDQNELNADDDVAHTIWGDGWRMPSVAEMQELIDNCTWVWTTQNDVKGYKITGKNGNKIFLPAAGFRSNDGKGSSGNYGYYWCNSVVESDASGAYELIFNSYNHSVSGDYRFDGRCIRPVHD